MSRTGTGLLQTRNPCSPCNLGKTDIETSLKGLSLVFVYQSCEMGSLVPEVKSIRWSVQM